MKLSWTPVIITPVTTSLYLILNQPVVNMNKIFIKYRPNIICSKVPKDARAELNMLQARPDCKSDSNAHRNLKGGSTTYSCSMWSGSIFSPCVCRGFSMFRRNIDFWFGLKVLLHLEIWAGQFVLTHNTLAIKSPTIC